MVSIRIDRRAFYVLLAILGLGIPLALGYVVASMMPGRATTSNTTAPASQSSSAAGQAQPAPAQPEVQPQDSALAGVPRMTIDEAKAQFGKPDVIFYDVRTPDQYNTAHIDGATSLPEIDVANQIDKLPKDKDLILYCT